MPIHPCAAKTDSGDEIEIRTSNGAPQRYIIDGRYKLAYEGVTVPVIAIRKYYGNKLMYYFSDVISDKSFASEYCIPIHESYISPSYILKVYRKCQQ
jgi:hypothetical protein